MFLRTFRIGLAAAFCIAVAAAGVSATSSSIVINEVDVDMAGLDSQEFIELYGTPGASLTGYVLVLYNGYNDRSYTNFELDGYTFNANGFFVLGNAGVAAASIVFPDNMLQNGADAVALYQAEPADFPYSTPVTTQNLVDAVVYGTNDPDDGGLLPLLNPGEPQVDEAAYGDSEGHSIQRCPDTAGGLRVTSGYIQAAPTPGYSNNGNCNTTSTERSSWGKVKNRFRR